MRRALLAALVLVPLSVLSAQDTQAGPHELLTIRLLSAETESAVLSDRSPIGQISKGDVLFVRSTLRNAVPQLRRPKGAIVGSDSVVFDVLSRTSAQVTVETYLREGWFVGGGRVRFGPSQRFRITDGGGRFALARGTGQSIGLGGNDSRRLKIYRLRLP